MVVVLLKSTLPIPLVILMAILIIILIVMSVILVILLLIMLLIRPFFLSLIFVYLLGQESYDVGIGVLHFVHDEAELLGILELLILLGMLERHLRLLILFILNIRPISCKVPFIKELLDLARPLLFRLIEFNSKRLSSP